MIEQVYSYQYLSDIIDEKLHVSDLIDGINFNLKPTNDCFFRTLAQFKVNETLTVITLFYMHVIERVFSFYITC